jgi:uncharacterized protein YjbI with pentapeptide repeats
MKTIEIKNRWYGTTLFSCEITVEDMPYEQQLGFAVRKAVASNIRLSDANLRGADLRGADLSRCDLSHAILSSASLSGSNLSRASLRGANLSGAKLSGADLSSADLSSASLSRCDLSHASLSSAILSGANLRGASLRGAKLSGAKLSGADLSSADLSQASLSYADLSSASLSYADLSCADLSRANLSKVKQDFLAEVLHLPNELEALKDALLAGQVDDSIYSGSCACLANTLAKAHGISNYNGGDINLGNNIVFHANAESPREMFFTAIRPGDTPEKNGVARIALQWTEEAIAIRDMIRATAPREAV